MTVFEIFFPGLSVSTDFGLKVSTWRNPVSWTYLRQLLIGPELMAVRALGRSSRMDGPTADLPNYIRAKSIVSTKSAGTHILFRKPRFRIDFIFKSVAHMLIKQTFKSNCSIYKFKFRGSFNKSLIIHRWFDLNVASALVNGHTDSIRVFTFFFFQENKSYLYLFTLILENTNIMVDWVLIDEAVAFSLSATLFHWLHPALLILTVWYCWLVPKPWTSNEENFHSRIRQLLDIGW